MTGSPRHGLVIGKFYPPHRGHQYLISHAAMACGQVTVLVMAAPRETIALRDRMAWLREAVADKPWVAVSGVACDASVDYGDASVWAAQVAVMRAALARDGRPPVDAVFSSEPYGAELARWFSAAHVTVDAGREAVPVSASQVRLDLAGNWDWLVPAARTGLTTRVVVLGAESTGTTTVAGLLAEHFALTQAGHSWVLLTGSLEDRARLAIRATGLALADRASFGASVTEASGAMARGADGGSRAD